MKHAFIEVSEHLFHLSFLFLFTLSTLILWLHDFALVKEGEKR
ncbi:hypothetical protein SLEP1_g15370 [Rubroshorea leprosula]|uniref:Uncharacterized protein n=1 Tax=Rubroshorea leprosula TaxID=152421 RepID=A0AAV5IUX4_9ROSI|nr:hypothetical protein SLEP1_g15370 [Rubroshorea leprosula]